jgi:hypothetical protein
MQAARDIMLDSREPKSEEDWCRIVNFWAANVHEDSAREAVRLLCLLFECPLERKYIDEIVTFQLQRRSN